MECAGNRNFQKQWRVSHVPAVAEDDDLEQRRESSLQTSLDGYDEEDSEKKRYWSCWKPELKTMGRCNLSLLVVIQLCVCCVCLVLVVSYLSLVVRYCCMLCVV